MRIAKGRCLVFFHFGLKIQLQKKNRRKHPSIFFQGVLLLLYAPKISIQKKIKGLHGAKKGPVQVGWEGFARRRREFFGSHICVGWDPMVICCRSHFKKWEWDHLLAFYLGWEWDGKLECFAMMGPNGNPQKLRWDGMGLLCHRGDGGTPPGNVGFNMGCSMGQHRPGKTIWEPARE